MSHFVLIIMALLALAGCQVKEEQGSGQLIAGHTPATNAFTVSAPTGGTYKAGDIISITLNFPYDVTVAGGTPSVSLSIGGSTVNAPLSSGAGSKNLIFRYTVLVSENDTDGVDLNSLALNGATMKFTAAGTTTDCNTNISSQNYSNVLVDNTGPTLNSFSLVTLPGFYNEGDSIVFSATYSEPVIVTAPLPSIGLTFNTPASATYVSGSGTTTINFSYTITSTQVDLNGYGFSSTSFANGTSIKDASGNLAGVDFSAYSAAIDGTGSTSDFVEFDGRAPFIVNIIPPSAGNYPSAANLDYVVEFNKNVTVTNTPYLALTVGATTRRANYSSGSGTRFLTFRYTTVPGDVDADGITSPASITADTGTIVSTTGGYNYFITGTNSGAFTNNSFTAPDTSGIILTATQPQPTAVVRGADTTDRVFPTTVSDNIWIIGQPLLITVEFNTGMYVNQTGGTPYVPLTIGASTVNATYLSGGDGQTSLVFRYVIQEGDFDNDGTIGIGTIDLNSGTITDAANTNTLLTMPVSTITSTQVDGVRPVLNTVTPPADSTYSTTTTPNNLWFILNWSEAVNLNGVINLPLTIGATAANAGTIQAGNNSAAVTLRTNGLTGYNDTDGIAVASPLTGAGSIRDQAGNLATVLTFPLPLTTGVLVDTTAPTIVGVTTPPAGTYVAGDDLDFTVTFSENVDVNVGAGYVRIALAFDTGTKYATYTSGSGSTVLNFSYTVAANDSDTNGITNPNAVLVNTASSSYIRDIALNGAATASFTMSGAANLAGVIVDGVAPTISSKTTTAGTYVDSSEGALSSIIISVTYSEAVDVIGTPEILLTLDSGAKSATYDAGTSTATVLKFVYDINSATDMDLDGVALANPSIQLGGATIKDLQDNDAALTLTTITGLSSVLVAPHAAVWMRASATNKSGFTTKPTITPPGVAVGGYYDFDGTNELVYPGLNSVSVEDVFMAIRTPAAVDFPPAQELIGSGYVSLDDGVINLTINGSGPASLTPSTAHQIQFNFGGANLPNTFTPMGYTGSIAEVLIFNSTLSGGQTAVVNSYLSSY